MVVGIAGCNFLDLESQDVNDPCQLCSDGLGSEADFEDSQTLSNSCKGSNDLWQSYYNSVCSGLAECSGICKDNFCTDAKTISHTCSQCLDKDKWTNEKYELCLEDGSDK